MSLKLWLPLRGNLNNQGISDATATNGGGVTFASSGNFGSNARFPGSSTGFLRLPPLLQATDEFTIAFWMKLDSITSNVTFYSQRNAANATGFTIFYVSSNTVIRFDDGSTLNATLPSAAANKWYHVVCCRDSEKKYIYINGILAASGNKGTPSAVNSNYSLIGGSQANAAGSTPTANYMAGYLNDYRIYDHCISAVEAHELSQGLLLHYTFETANCGRPNLILNGLPHLKNVTSNWSAWVNSGGWQAPIYCEENGYSFMRAKCLISGKQGGIHHPPADYTALKNGVTYTLSAFIRASAPCQIRFYQEYMTTTNIIDISTEWKFYSYSCALDTSKANHSDVFYCMPETAVEGLTIDIRMVKLEEGDGATAWRPHVNDSIASLYNGGISNDAGYKIPNSITGTIISAGTNARGKSGIYLPHDTATTIDICLPNEDTNTCDFSKIPQGTFSMWINRHSTNTGWRHYAYFASNYNWTGVTADFLIIGSTGGAGLTMDCCSNTFGYTPNLNEWNMYTISWDLDAHIAKMYVNGELKATKNDDKINTTYAATSATSHYIGNAWNDTSASHGALGIQSDYSIDDVRIYSTCLLDSDIKMLYNTSMRIDKNNNIHPFNLFEGAKNDIDRRGNLNCNTFSEYNGMSFLKYDPDLYIEDDGSCWVHIFHHCNPHGAAFTQGDTFDTSCYIDADRWFNVEVCNYIDKWELMTKFTKTYLDTVRVSRWIQTANPLTATFAETTASKITRIRADDGVNSYWGGIYKLNNSKTYLTTNDGTDGHWYGDYGCFITDWANGGIPGFSSGTNDCISTGTIDLYVRIDNVDFNNASAKTTKNNMWIGNQIIER